MQNGVRSSKWGQVLNREFQCATLPKWPGPLRFEFANALYHITSRGNRREDIYLDDSDQGTFLNILQQVGERFNWVCHSYCLMSNHYHLLVETPEANLSLGMSYAK